MSCTQRSDMEYIVRQRSYITHIKCSENCQSVYQMPCISIDFSDQMPVTRVTFWIKDPSDHGPLLTLLEYWSFEVIGLWTIDYLDDWPVGPMTIRIIKLPIIVHSNQQWSSIKFSLTSVPNDNDNSDYWPFELTTIRNINPGVFKI